MERELVHALKYNGDPTLGRRLGATMAREFSALRKDQNIENWSVLPVPLHKRRRRKRGYNQSALLAEGWSSVTGMHCTPLLLRKHAGQSFTRFNRNQRIARQTAPFDWPDTHTALHESNKGYIILDDVITTGSTLESMHRTLRTRWQGPLAFVTLADAAR